MCAAVRRDPRSFAANYSVRALPLGVLMALAAPDAAVSVAGHIRRQWRSAPRQRRQLVRKGHAQFGHAARSRSVATTRRWCSSTAISASTSTCRATRRAPRCAASCRDQGELEGALTLAMAESDPSLAGRASAQTARPGAAGLLGAAAGADLRGSGAARRRSQRHPAAPARGLTVRGAGLDAEVPLLGCTCAKATSTPRSKPGGRFQAEGSIISGDGTLRLSGTRDAAAGPGAQARAAAISWPPTFPARAWPSRPIWRSRARPARCAHRHRSRSRTPTSTSRNSSFARSYQRLARRGGRRSRATREGPVAGTDDRRAHPVRRKREAGGLRPRQHGQRRTARAPRSPNEASRATGEIRVAGTYEAFGRKLTIERGRLQYAGTALDDPQLDILARAQAART